MSKKESRNFDYVKFHELLKKRRETIHEIKIDNYLEPVILFIEDINWNIEYEMLKLTYLIQK